MDKNDKSDGKSDKSVVKKSVKFKNNSKMHVIKNFGAFNFEAANKVLA